MTDATSSDSFSQVVEWAYNTLPQKIKDLPDFPGIQVADEPPEDVLKRIRKQRNWPNDRELLGLFSGFHRNQPQQSKTRIAPDLIFVFQGPIQRCSTGNLPAEVKQVVWHEVAHWLGHDEDQVNELRLSLAFEDMSAEHIEGLASDTHSPDEPGRGEQQPHCIRCYSADVACREVLKPLSYAGANAFDPITVDTKSYKCNSCGCTWDDEDAD